MFHVIAHPAEDDVESSTFVSQVAEAERLKAERAREYFEGLREAEIRKKREGAGVCVLCGKSLSVVGRIRGSLRHRRCSSFTE